MFEYRKSSNYLVYQIMTLYIQIICKEYISSYYINLVFLFLFHRYVFNVESPAVSQGYL